MPGPDDAPVSWADFDKALDDEAPAAPPVAEALGDERLDDERLDDEPRGRWDDEAEVEGVGRPPLGLVVPDLARCTVQAVAGRLRARLLGATQ